MFSRWIWSPRQPQLYPLQLQSSVPSLSSSHFYFRTVVSSVITTATTLKMTVSGLSFTPSRCWLQMPVHCPGLLGRQVFSRGFKPKGIPLLGRYNTQQTHLVRYAMGASYSNKENDPNASSDVFPRIDVEDPYRRLGVRREASDYEIQSARNFLIYKYAGHKPSLDAIESAHDSIIVQKFYENQPKIGITEKVRNTIQSKVVQPVGNRFRTPSPEFMIKTSIAFLALAVLTVLCPTDEGPTFQVAVSFFTTIYFIQERLQRKIRAFLYGVGFFAGAWLFGTFLMTAVIPHIPMFRGALGSFEMSTSLITYVLLWVSTTYLK